MTGRRLAPDRAPIHRQIEDLRERIDLLLLAVSYLIQFREPTQVDRTLPDAMRERAGFAYHQLEGRTPKLPEENPRDR